MTAAQRFLDTKSALRAPKLENSLLDSPLAGNLRGDGCNQHCIPSQAVRRSEKVSSTLAERRGPLLIKDQSLGSSFRASPSQKGDSLRRIYEKLTFLGDCGRRRVRSTLRGPGWRDQRQPARPSLRSIARCGSPTKIQVPKYRWRVFRSPWPTPWRRRWSLLPRPAASRQNATRPGRTFLPAWRRLLRDAPPEQETSRLGCNIRADRLRHSTHSHARYLHNY